ncbi:MAG TPA: C45 family peptidase [Kofleriaceae bacterium]|nr:C45 family peptidase [Kofleriaceae bacterium]
MSELLIGGRRPGRHRRLRSLAILAILVLLAALAGYFIFRRMVAYDEPSGSSPSGPVVASVGEGGASLTWGGCALRHEGGIAVVRLVGGAHTLGACHGRLLGGAVGRATAPLVGAVEASVPRDGLIAGLFHGARLRWRYRLLDDGMPPAQLEEIAGVAHGAGVSFEDLVRAQAALDVGAPSARAAGGGYRAVARALSVGVPATGPSLIGRTVSLLGAADGGEGARPPLVRFVAREGAIPFASVGWAGQVGVVTGINARGIAIFVHPASSTDVKPTRLAQPAALIARDVLETAGTLDKAVAVVEQASPLGAAGYLIVDGARQVAWIERSPTRTRVVRSPSPVAYGDVLTTEPFAEDADNDRARRTRPSLARVQRAAELARRAPGAAAEHVVAILRDAAAPGGQELPPGHRGAIDDPSAAHTVIVDPAGLLLWVADGPGAGGRFRAFDLRHELRGEPPREALLAGQPADPARDPAVAEQVLAALRDLRGARDAAADDERGRARELVARALARRPDLPAALLLAGDLARAAGDVDAARAHYGRYLEVGDDLAAVDQVRSYLREE